MKTASFLIIFESAVDTIIYIFVALFIAWIWVDYFRLIDVFEKESLLRVAVIFLLGAVSVLPVLGLHMLIQNPFGIEMNGEFVNDYLYCIFDTGLVEESSKALLFGVAFLCFRKHINEPVDFVAAMSVCALGFAAAENVMYFSRYGAHLISSRAVLSTLGHMMFTSILAYAIILIKFRGRKPGILIFAVCLLISAAFHGTYNFWLMYEVPGNFGWITTILIFLLGISVFATILNNALNISPFFTYKHVIHSFLVVKRLFIYYFALFLVQCTLYFWRTDLKHTAQLVLQNAYVVLPVVLISIVRLSRFKLIRGKWNMVRPELPFSVSFGGDRQLVNPFGFRISVKGDPFSDYSVNVFFEKDIRLSPLSRKSGYLKHSRRAYIYDKLYINQEEAHYAVRIYIDETSDRHELALLQIKHKGTTSMNHAPIVAILDSSNIKDLKSGDNDVKAPFLEWATIAAIPEVQGQRA